MVDNGVKRSIVRNLPRARRHRRASPTHGDAGRPAANDPDAIFLANGPGDPAALDYVVATVGELLGKRPVYGICLGHQLLVPRGRPRDVQAPVRPPRRQPPGQGPDDRAIEITSQNHGFAVARPERARTIDATRRCAGRPTSAPPSSRTSTCTTARSRGSPPRRPGATVQYHPEAGPGPHDARPTCSSASLAEVQRCRGVTTSTRSA